MDKKKILILCYNNLVSDPRVQRQLSALRNQFNIEVCATGDTGIAGIPFHLIYEMPAFSIGRKLKRFFQLIFRFYDKLYWDNFKIKLVEKLKSKDYDVIIANDIQTLPLALGIAANRSKIYFDSHDYHPLEFNDNLRWRFLYKPYVKFLCRKYIPRANAFSTSSQSIAEGYKNFINIMPEIITNATHFYDLTPVTTNADNIKLIHHGAAIEGRRIEVMIEAMAYLDTDKYALFLMLTEQGSRYYNELKKFASGFKNVFFVNPVQFTEIVPFINKYDIGFYCLAPTNFNNQNLLPNKIFEFIQARLCIVTSPTREMVNLVVNYNLGLVSNGYTAQAMSDAVKAITPGQIMKYKQNCHVAASKLSSQQNLKKINAIVSGLVS